MPELPEVEAARCIIEEHCVGREITLVDAAADEKIFEGSTPEQLVVALQGRRLLAVGRKGKNLWLTLDGEGPMPLMHFGMTGYIAVRDAAGQVHIVAYENAPQGAGSWPPRFHKLLLHFGPHPDKPNGPASCELAYCDARRFGRVKLVVSGDPGSSEAITKLGFDPLMAMPSLEAFRARLADKAKGARLKPLLLDQTFCAGVGNWVADEVLWHARLHPEQLVSALQPHHTAALHSALRDVVQTAVAANADSSKFPADWMFHVRWGKKAGTLAGHKIDHITVGSRTSCYVPALQKLISGDIAQGSKAAKPAAGRKRKGRQQEEGQEEQQQEEKAEKEVEASGSEVLEKQPPAASAGPTSKRGKKAAAAAPSPVGRNKAQRRPRQTKQHQQEEGEADVGSAVATSGAAEEQGNAGVKTATAVAGNGHGRGSRERRTPDAEAAAASSRKKRR